MRGFLRTDKTRIRDADGKNVHLRGVNFGGWLMMEGYILHAPNRAEQLFKKDFRRARGQRNLARFEEAFYGNYIRESDVRNVARLGFNCIRVPFNSRLIETKPYRYSEQGIAHLDRVVGWAKKHKVRLVLDLHAACGPQSHDWHADSLGKATLWNVRNQQKRTLALWEFVADRYKNETAVAGYDILNEAVTDDIKRLNRFYKEVIRAIRKNDKNHILFIEGNKWAMDLDCLDDFADDNVALSAHFYHPLEFTFNFIPQLTYPLRSARGKWDRKTAEKELTKYKKISEKRQRPILIGEFGVNAREGLYGEDRWLKEVLAIFNRFGFHWTYWTYKAMKNSVFPDGIYSYRDNPDWVHRQGPDMGWETYARLWPRHKNEMAASWRTEKFKPNTKILKALRDALR